MNTTRKTPFVGDNVKIKCGVNSGKFMRVLTVLSNGSGAIEVEGNLGQKLFYSAKEYLTLR